MAKIKLTPAQIALASSDTDELSFGTANIKDDGLAEVPETYDERDDEPDDSNYLPDNEEIPDVEDEGSIDAEGAAEDLPSWIDDETRAYAHSYGLSDNDLRSFDDRESLDRFGEITDRRLAAHQEYQQPAPRKEDVDDEQTDSVSVEPEEFELFDPQVLVDERYDDTTIAIGKALRATQERLKEVLPLMGNARQQAESEHRQRVAKDTEQFEKTLDKLDKSLFGTLYKDGKASELNSAHDANRRAVFDAAESLRRGIEEESRRSGKKIEVPLQVLVERAAKMAFGDVRRRYSGSDADRLSQQSRRRRPTGGRGGQTRSGMVRSTTGDDDAASLSNAPKIKQFWQKTQRENGMM